MLLRNYRSGDEVGIVSLWNRACPQDPMSMNVFIKRVLVDPNFDAEGLFVYEVDDTIVGMLLAIVRKIPLSGSDLEPDNGWITTFFVDPEHQKRGIASEMFKAAEGFFKSRGRKRVYFSSYAPNYFVPGLDEQLYGPAKQFLDKQGFRVLYSPVAMDKNLVGYAYPEDVRQLEELRTQEGYAFEFLTPAYITQVIEFNDQKFNPDWARAIRDAISQGVGLEHILIARKDDKVVAFCMYGAYDGVGERFGPFGVDPDLRGTGLGKVLLYKCLQVMRANGLHNAWFLWTGETSPAGYLYFRAGFNVTRKFHVMCKDI